MSKAVKNKIHSNPSSVEDKLYFIKLRPNTESHIKTNQDKCRICEKKECISFCPANVFNWSEVDSELIIAYENCLECGACTVGCPYNNIDYSHPKSGYGLI